MSERVQIYSLVNDIKEIADYIKVSLDFKAPTLVCDVGKARDAGSHAQQILSYIQANNDYELAQCCCRIDRSLFLLAQGKYSLRPDIILSFSRCHQALFDIQNFILERLYEIPYKDIRGCRYAISHDDGECYEISEGAAKKIIPLTRRRDEADVGAVHFIGRADGKCHKTDNDGNEQQEMYDPEGTSSKPQYSDALRSLFKNRVDLIDGLCGLTDKEIAQRIKALAKERDKFGKPLIQNPANHGNKTKFADALKGNGLITCTADQFRRDPYL